MISAAILAESGSISVFQHFVKEGGWITWFVLIPLSLLTVSLTFHYMIVVRRSGQLPSGLRKALLAAAKQGQLRYLLQITQDDESMLGRAAHAGVIQLRGGRASARVAIDEIVEERSTKLFRKIEYLNVIGNISPMIGLIGTVVGMIQAFSRISAAGGGMPEPGKLAGDIAVALVTTFWGILIAIPALTAHAIFRNRIDAFAAECVKLCDEVVALVMRQRRPTAAEGPIPARPVTGPAGAPAQGPTGMMPGAESANPTAAAQPNPST